MTFVHLPDPVPGDIQDALGQVGFDGREGTGVLHGAEVVIVTLKVVCPALTKLYALNHSCHFLVNEISTYKTIKELLKGISVPKNLKFIKKILVNRIN